jgi:hypothetical protein
MVAKQAIFCLEDAFHGGLMAIDVIVSMRLVIFKNQD